MMSSAKSVRAFVVEEELTITNTLCSSEWMFATSRLISPFEMVSSAYIALNTVTEQFTILNINSLYVV